MARAGKAADAVAKVVAAVAKADVAARVVVVVLQVTRRKMPLKKVAKNWSRRLFSSTVPPKS